MLINNELKTQDRIREKLFGKTKYIKALVHYQSRYAGTNFWINAHTTHHITSPMVIGGGACRCGGGVYSLMDDELLNQAERTSNTRRLCTLCKLKKNSFLVFNVVELPQCLMRQGQIS